MLSLLKNDLRRIIKDQSFIVVFIIGIILSIIGPIFYKVLYVSIDGQKFLDSIVINENNVGSSIVAVSTARGQFYGSFAPMSLVNLIISSCIVAIIFKDFGQGTIRNKIVSGHSRTNILLSMFISCFIVLTTVILINSFLKLLISLILLNYGMPFDSHEFGYFISSIIFAILAFAFIASLMVFSCVFAKKSSDALLSYIGNAILFLILPILGQAIIELQIAAKGENAKEIVDFIEFLIKIDVINNITDYVGKSLSYTTSQVLYFTLSAIFLTGLFVLFSWLRLRKKDIK